MNREIAKRLRLGFNDVVAQYLTPLLANHGLKCMDSGPYFVAYESPSVAIVVRHEIDSYEIDIRFSLVGSPNSEISLFDLLRAKVGDAVARRAMLQASTRLAVEHSIQKMASLVSKYGQEIISGNRREFVDVGNIAHGMDRKYTRKVVQRPIRAAALRAWNIKDFEIVVKLYESIEQDLSLVELQKLRFARKRYR